MQRCLKWGRMQSSAVCSAINSADQTSTEDASNTGESLLNQTGEVVKKIIGGAATVLGNVSGEIKERVRAKYTLVSCSCHNLFIFYILTRVSTTKHTKT